MKKIITLTALILVAILALTGCAKPVKIDKIINEVLKEQQDKLLGAQEDQPQVTDAEPITTRPDKTDPPAGKSMENTFAEFQEAKSSLISRINQISFGDPDLGLDVSMTLINLYEVDAIMWPAFILWSDEAVVEQTGRFLGMTNFKVKKAPNEAQMTYEQDNGRALSFKANYDERHDRYMFQADYDDGDKPYLEIARTPYGLIGQAYTGGVGMLNHLFLISMEGGNGVIGLIRDAAYPEPLTGQEAFDFPKSAPEWYHYQNGRLTGVSRQGESIDLSSSD